MVTTESREVILNEVLYIPQLGVNLVSLGLLQRSSSMHAVMDGEDGTLYFIECVDGSNHTALVMSSGSMCLWHRCMGHLSPSFGIQSPLQWLYAWSILQVATTGLEFFIILEDGVGCYGFDRPNVHPDVGR